MRTIITGDIHGCFDEFEELLKKVNLMPVDKLIILGDLFDRGSNSYEVFQKVLFKTIFSVPKNIFFRNSGTI